MLSPRFMPQSVVRIPQSMFYTDRNPTILDRINPHKRLFRRYERGLALVTKTRTILLFTNTTLNRFDFGETAFELFTSETMKPGGHVGVPE